MKKLVIGLITLALTVGLSLSAEALPPGAGELEAWEWDGTKWDSMEADGIEANAKAWSSGPESGDCNKTFWSTTVKVHASVAQWLEFSLSGTRWDWQVRKPGTYATDCITATVASNGDLEIDFDGFANLLGTDGEIPTWYAYGKGPVGTLTWIEAGALNGMDAQILDCVGLHAGYSWKLWNKIEVVECNSACEYDDEATITLVLDNQKDWIDPKTGLFALGPG